MQEGVRNFPARLIVGLFNWIKVPRLTAQLSFINSFAGDFLRSVGGSASCTLQHFNILHGKFRFCAEERKENAKRERIMMTRMWGNGLFTWACKLDAELGIEALLSTSGQYLVQIKTWTGTC